MCWIFWYAGDQPALPYLMQGLQRLEYRGYDSAGIMIMDTDGQHHLIKEVWKVSDLQSKINQDVSSDNYKTQTYWIGHTRWATHGVPSIVNTHPHIDTQQKFFVVHNGIIENHVKLKKMLEKDHGYTFVSQTDTEVLPALLSVYRTGDLLETVHTILPLLHGAYALVVMTSHSPNIMVAVKRWSPLLFGLKDNHSSYVFSSDEQALTGIVDKIIRLEDGECLHLFDGNYTIQHEGKHIQKNAEDIDITTIQEDKGEFATFMLKEIYEQPAIISRACRGRIHTETKDIASNSVQYLENKNIQKVVFVGCGTSYHAWCVGAEWINTYTNIDAHAVIASEYIHSRIDTKATTMHVFLSQSGETADTIEILKYVKANEWITMGIVNVVGSTIAHMTDCGFFLRAWYEIWVASTKACTAQLIHILFLVLFLWRKSWLSYQTYSSIIETIDHIPDLMQQTLDLNQDIKQIAHQLHTHQHMFFLGRHVMAHIAREWALKLKEISYIHAESYPTGELKHGPLALIEETFPSVLLAPHNEHFALNMSSLSEIQSRKGKVLVISDTEVESADRCLTIPSWSDIAMPFIMTVALQLLAYHTADYLGKDIDKPRNLAKSVTVT